MINSCGSCKHFTKGKTYSLCDALDAKTTTDGKECKLYKRIKFHKKIKDVIDLRTTNESS